MWSDVQAVLPQAWLSNFKTFFIDWNEPDLKVIEMKIKNKAQKNPKTKLY